MVPPPSFVDQYDRKDIAGTRKLMRVVSQKVESISSGMAFNMSFSERKQTYASFKRKALSCDENLNIQEYEDRFWEYMKRGVSNSMKPSFGIDNNFSLFGESCSSWNLNKLTYSDSIIHKVRFCMFLLYSKNFNVPPVTCCNYSSSGVGICQFWIFSYVYLCI